MRIALLFLAACLLPTEAARAQTQVALEFYGIEWHLPRVAPEGETDALSDFNDRPCASCPTRLERLHERWLDHPDIDRWYEALESRRQQWQLNDWLWFKLLRTAIDGCWPQADTAFRHAMLWHLLTRSGYRLLLAWNEAGVQVFAHSEDEVFGLPFLSRPDGTWYRLGWPLPSADEKEKGFFIARYRPQGAQRSFDFDMHTQPLMPPRPARRTLTFEWQGRTIRVCLQYDARWADMLDDLPILEEGAWFDIPFSRLLQTSVETTLAPLLRELPFEAQLHLLLNLCRLGLPYQTDEQQFGRTRPMAADQVLAWPASDCEDKAAFFFQLNKLLLRRPALACSWPDHVSIALHLPTPLRGTRLRYQGRPYTLCDPTQVVEGVHFLSFSKQGTRPQNARIIACDPPPR